MGTEQSETARSEAEGNVAKFEGGEAKKTFNHSRVCETAEDEGRRQIHGWHGLRYEGGKVEKWCVKRPVVAHGAGSREQGGVVRLEGAT